MVCCINDPLEGSQPSPPYDSSCLKLTDHEACLDLLGCSWAQVSLPPPPPPPRPWGVPVNPSGPVYWPASSCLVCWCTSASGRSSPGLSAGGQRRQPAAACPSWASLWGPGARRKFLEREPRRKRLEGRSTGDSESLVNLKLRTTNQLLLINIHPDHTRTSWHETC